MDDLHPYSILVVEDNQRWQALAEQIITRTNHWNYQPLGYKTPTITIAETPAQGLELLTGNPDLVLLDINFNPSSHSDTSGLGAFLVPARQRGYGGYVLCWSSESSHRWAARKLGADDFINKRQVEKSEYELADAIVFFMEKGKK